MSTENKSNTPAELKDSWQTPKFIFDHYYDRFEFAYDLAASEDNSLTGLYCSEEDSAFDRDPDSFLTGAIWCNPPYSNITPWVNLCIDISVMSGQVVAMLIPSDTSVKWFKMAYESCTECHFISGRISFINAETDKPVNGNNKGSVIFIFNPLSPVKQSVHLINRDDMR